MKNSEMGTKLAAQPEQGRTAVKQGIWTAVLAAVPVGMMVMCIATSMNLKTVAAAPDDYVTKVQPIISAHCAGCHNPVRLRGGLDLTTKDGIMKGGEDGVVIVPGNVDKTLLLKLIKHQPPAGGPGAMPPGNRPALSADEIAVIEQWVKDGAVIPADAAPTAVPPPPARPAPAAAPAAAPPAN